MSKEPATSYLSRIRGVDLLPAERVGAMLSPEGGLISEPTGDGHLLVVTDSRILSIVDTGETQARQLFAIGSVAGISVRNDVRNGFGWRHWIALIAGGVVVYLALAYWLVDRLPEIIIPVINLHAFALAIMLLVILAGWLFWRGFTQPGGRTVQIHGNNWSIEAQCDAAQEDLMGFAQHVMAMQGRRRDVGASIGAAEGQ